MPSASAIYAKGFSYLTNDPSACANCHIMNDHYGFWHSFAFTTGDFPDPLRIKPGNLEVTEEACLKCHQNIVAAIVPGPHLTGTGDRPLPEEASLSCVRCHDSVGHWVR